MKVMYSCQLSLETKCPNCHSKIMSIGGTLYACQSGHVIECVVMVTLNNKATTVSTANKPTIEHKEDVTPPPQRQIHQHSSIQTDDVILPPKIEKLQ